MDNPFDFPSCFWFGWSLCWAALLTATGIVIALVLVVPVGPAFAWLLPVGCWINAAFLCGNAIQERRYQKEIAALAAARPEEP